MGWNPDPKLMWEPERVAEMERRMRPLFMRASEAMPGRFKTLRLTQVNCEKLAADLFARGENDPEFRQFIHDNFRRDLWVYPDGEERK